MDAELYELIELKNRRWRLASELSALDDQLVRVVYELLLLALFWKVLLS